VIWVDADEVLVLVVEAVLAILGLLKLVLVEVGPAPDFSVDDVGESLSASNLSNPLRVKEFGLHRLT
jgi:hypothetical protein